MSETAPAREWALPCFKCGAPLKNLDGDNHPTGGTEFTSYGHYGSTFWDPGDSRQLVANLCDECLREHPERLAVARVVRASSTEWTPYAERRL